MTEAPCRPIGNIKKEEMKRQKTIVSLHQQHLGKTGTVCLADGHKNSSRHRQDVLWTEQV